MSSFYLLPMQCDVNIPSIYALSGPFSHVFLSCRHVDEGNPQSAHEYSPRPDREMKEKKKERPPLLPLLLFCLCSSDRPIVLITTCKFSYLQVYTALDSRFFFRFSDFILQICLTSLHFIMLSSISFALSVFLVFLSGSLSGFWGPPSGSPVPLLGSPVSGFPVPLSGFSTLWLMSFGAFRRPSRLRERVLWLSPAVS